jgi:hypothetical protein
MQDDEREGVETPSLDGASAAAALIAKDRDNGPDLRSLRRIALGDVSGELGLKLPALPFGEDAARQLRAQFVDMIDCKHVRLRLDDVDAARATEGRGKDRAATSGAGERGSRFCRLFDKIGGTVRPCGGPSSRTIRRNRERRIAAPKGTRPHVFLARPCRAAEGRQRSPRAQSPDSSQAISLQNWSLLSACAINPRSRAPGNSELEME